MQVLGCLFFLILAIVLFLVMGVLSILVKVLSALGINIPWFKFIKTPTSFNPGDFQQQNTSSSTQQSTTFSQEQPKERKKIYAEDEGEYVEFEEIKED